jgi:hypothetical protein
MTIAALELRTPEVSPSPLLRLEAGTYVTDEQRLFRCLSTAPAHEPGATALLEDCLTLEHVVFPLDQLVPESLRIVQPELGGTGLQPVVSCL